MFTLRPGSALESAHTLVGCSQDDGTDLIAAMIGSRQEVVTTTDGDHLTVRHGDQVVELERVRA